MRVGGLGCLPIYYLEILAKNENHFADYLKNIARLL